MDGIYRYFYRLASRQFGYGCATIYARQRERETGSVREREIASVCSVLHMLIAWPVTSSLGEAQVAGSMEGRKACGICVLLAKIDNESAHKLCSILFGGANAKNKTVNNIVNSTDNGNGNGNNNKNLNERIHVTFINYQKRLCCLSRCDFNCHLFLIATVSLSLSLSHHFAYALWM